MMSLTSKTRLFALATIALMAGIMLLVFVIDRFAHADSHIKSLLVDKQPQPYGNEQVAILGVSSNDSPITFGANVQAEDNFLQSLSVTVKNSSQKDISHLQVGLLVFSKTMDKSPKALFKLRFGNNTGYPGVKANKNLSPNEKITLSLPENERQSVSKLISRVAPNYEKITVVIDFVVFKNDIAWRHGFFHRRSPDDPKRWVAVRSLTDKPLTMLQPASFTRSQYCGMYGGTNFIQCAGYPNCGTMVDWATYGTQDTFHYTWTACYPTAEEADCFGAYYDTVYFLGLPC